MKAHVVVDIGNTRLKWGLVEPDKTNLLEVKSLPDDPAAWQQTIQQWRCRPPYSDFAGPLMWVVASVNPGRADRLFSWISDRGERFFHLRNAHLPLRINVEQPDRVGIDRLLNAVAVARREPLGNGCVLIDAGSAVTVDWLDEERIFQGGIIFPGLDLMAEALHRYTAMLPRVSVDQPSPSLPAKATIPAIQAGICLAVAGGIREAVRCYGATAATVPRIYLTGGQARLLAEWLRRNDQERPATHTWSEMQLWPEQTLMGILYSAESLP